MARTPRRPRPSRARNEGRIRNRTKRALQPSGPPTDEIPLWTSPDGVGLDEARAVIDLALRTGTAMLSTGAGAADVTSTVIELTQAYGLRSVSIDVTYTSVTLSYHRGPDADPITVMRVVKYRVQDFTRLERLRSLIVGLTAAGEPLPVEEARVRFDAIVQAPHPYRRWLVMVANAILAAAVAVLIGAGPFITVVTFVSAVLIERAQHALGRFAIAPFFTQVISAAIPTAGATLVVLAGRFGWDTASRASPSLIVASGIVLLLAGSSVVGAAEDALAGFYVTAGARAFELVVQTIGIVIGVSAVLSVGNRLGLYVAVTTQTTLDRHLTLQLVCSFIIAVTFSITTYAMLRSVLMSGVVGTVAWWALTALQDANLGAATASAGAAALVGILGRAASGRLRTSALMVTTAGIVPLLPGRAVYQGISQIVSDPDAGFQSGMTTLAGAAGIGLGIAAGVSIGSYVGGVVGAWRFGGTLPRVAGMRLPLTESRRPPEHQTGEHQTGEHPVEVGTGSGDPAAWDRT